MPKLLAFCDSPTAPTGFGKVAREILTRVKASFDVDITIWGINYDRSPHSLPFRIISSSKNEVGEFWDEKDHYLGRVTLAKMVKNGGWDLFWSVQDSFNMKLIAQELARKKADKSPLPSIFYFPVDAANIPQDWCQTAMEFNHPVAYTEFGKKQVLQRVGSTPENEKKISIAYHGTNTADFHPLPIKEVLAYRNGLRLYGNQFLFMNMNRNQVRKDIVSSILAFREFMRWWEARDFQTSPPKLLLHMNAVEEQGENIPSLVEVCFPDLVDHIIYPMFKKNGLSTEDVNRAHNAADCLITTTRGEGWGLCTTEAMAVRTPVIVPYNTSHPEILGKTRGKNGDAERGKFALSGHDSDHWSIMDGCSHYGDPIRPITSVKDMFRQMVRTFKDCTDAKGNRLPEPRGETRRQVEAAYKWSKMMTWNRVFKQVWYPLFAHYLPPRR